MCRVAVRASSWRQVLVIFFDAPSRSCRRCCSHRVVPRRSASDRAGPRVHVRLSRRWAAASPRYPECLWRSHRRLGVGLSSARGRNMMRKSFTAVVHTGVIFCPDPECDCTVDQGHNQRALAVLHWSSQWSLSSCHQAQCDQRHQGRSQPSSSVAGAVRRATVRVPSTDCPDPCADPGQARGADWVCSTAQP